MNKLITISALALGLVLAGCSVLPEDAPSGDGRQEIKFTASVGSFTVKATDNAFELGDAIGLFAESPVNAQNLRLTWDGTYLVPETKLFWAPDYGYRSEFQAYYPYDPEKTRDWTTFFVNADQSTHKLFTESDFMTATTVASSADGVVNLQFHHRFSKIILHVENLLEDLEIADVFVGNVRGRVQGNVWGNYDVAGLPGTIKACKAATPEGETVWALIIPSQWTCPQLMITAKDGRQFTYQPDDEIGFEAGFRYNAHVAVDGDTIFTDFTSEVTEWTDNNDLEFRMPGVEKWSVVSTGAESSKETKMFTCFREQDTYYALIYYKVGDQLSFTREGSSFTYGIPGGNYGKVGDFGFEEGGDAITLPYEGVYQIAIAPYDKSIYVNDAMADRLWSVTGTIEKMNWNKDHLVDSYTVIDENPVMVFSIKYREEQAFKFRFDGTWFFEYGYDSPYWDECVLPEGEASPLRIAGPNMRLPEEGYWDLYFDLNNCTVTPHKTGELPPYVPSLITIDGDFSDWDELDPTKVSVAYCVDGAKWSTLKKMKAYADANALFIYFEYDVNKLDTYYVPLQLFINSDNNTNTGGQGFYEWTSGYHDWNMWFNPGYDFLLEGFLFSDWGLNNYNPYVYRWSGNDGEFGWLWNDTEYNDIVEGAGNFEAYEFSIDRELFPELYDSVTVGLHIESPDWQPLGFLPNDAITEENTNGAAYMLPVNVGGPGVIAGANPKPSTYYKPFTIPEAIEYCMAGGTEDVYVKGIVSKTVEFSAQYGNVTFWISDDGQYLGDPGHDFEVYRARWFGGRNWQEGDVEAQVGDEVVIYGQLSKYKNFFETLAGKAYVLSLNGNDGDSNIENPEYGDEWEW